MYYTLDNAKAIKAEERVYSRWLRQEESRVLSMHNTKKKQESWNKLHPKFTSEFDNLPF